MLTQKMIDDIRMNLTSDSFVECIKVTWRKAQDEILDELIRKMAFKDKCAFCMHNLETIEIMRKRKSEVKI